MELQRPELSPLIDGEYSFCIEVADPGFSREGCANTKSAIIFQFFCRKLHENERIWTRGGAFLAPPWIGQCIGILMIKRNTKLSDSAKHLFEKETI